MKILLTLILVAIVGCASEPTLIKAKNCKEVSKNVFICEEIPVPVATHDHDHGRP